MHVSTVVPKDRRSSAACFSIRSTNAFPVIGTSSIQSMGSTSSLFGALRRLRFRSVVVIVIPAASRRSEELVPLIVVDDRLPVLFQLFNLQASAPRLAVHTGAKPLHARKV